MKTYLTIDGGTTNTRISLVTDGKIKTTRSLCHGIKDGKTLIEKLIRDTINEFRIEYAQDFSGISCILASGMLTSELGLYYIPHLTVPVGIKELHDATVKVVLPEISEIPFVFIPGVKTDCASLDRADMMRGEETELMGIIEENRQKTVYILPGSHSKIIEVDKNQNIINFRTMLTGEMIEALSAHTILNNSVDLSSASLIYEDLFSGYSYCKEHGLNESLFKVRILRNIFEKSNDEVYSFFLGCVLYDEIAEVLKMAPESIIIGGKAQLKIATAFLLQNVSNLPIRCVSDNDVKASTVRGVIAIYEKNNPFLRTQRYRN